jgi:molecular chaperone HtpG
MSAQQETHAFQAEVSRLLHLMVNAVYSEREVFLRELISNASDACDKLRYEAIANPALIGPDERLRITIATDTSAGTLAVSDNGIGMDRQELIDNLGTIARSGTRAFLERIEDQTRSGGLIGQFGVGFYAAFMVADSIEVTSAKAGSSEAWVWHSDGMSGFTVEEAPATPGKPRTTARGTTVLLKLKADCRGFLADDEIERIVRAYSDHILFPIEVVTAGKDPRQINAASALWHRSKSEVSSEDYRHAYRTLTGNLEEPLTTIHYKAEGRQSYAVLLFVPRQAPYDLFDPQRRGRAKLYVRRVFITADADLLPGYLRFVQGVIDSEDLPLNISREMLQKNPQVAQIRKAVAGRVLNELESFAARDVKGYESFIDTFGVVLKEGLYEDAGRRDQLLKLVRFRTTAGSGWRSLADYVAAMRPGQSEIYFLAGEDLPRISASPQLEAARARGVEVLLLSDPIDHFWTAMSLSFDGKPFRSLSQGDVDLSGIETLAKPDDRAAKPVAEASTKQLVDVLRKALGDAVTDVRPSKRLTESAVCLVAPRDGPDLGLDRMLQRHQRGGESKPVLEINPQHELIAAMSRCMEAGGEQAVSGLATFLLDEARILQGATPGDPARFVTDLNRMMLKALGQA